jgi:hypothetical protein
MKTWNIHSLLYFWNTNYSKMTNFLTNFPDEARLLQAYAAMGKEVIYEVNGHIHTPFSFSAFENITQPFEMASKEQVKILGINDFYVTDGYDAFAENAIKSKIFPLFNIEFITLSSQMQAEGIRVNDPNNPGRIYFSGKGLDFPPQLSATNARLLDSVREESQRQVAEMTDKTNALLQSINSDIRLNFSEIRSRYAKNLVRERHLAKAIRIAVFERYGSESERKAFLKLLYSGKETTVDINNASALENELRNNLLKAGGKAFVEEDEKAFLNTDQAKEIILDAGGIPCYPVLLDDKKGNYTDFEGNREKMLQHFKENNIHCIELIPGRNSIEALKDFVLFFYKHDFVITFGTEHNSPDLIPLTVDCRGKVSLDEELKRINFEGACIIAAHQYLHAKGKDGYVDRKGKADLTSKPLYIQLGKAVIAHFLKH